MATPSPLAIYVHWPWCLKKCPYCDFNSHVAETIPEEAYLNALLIDLAHQAALVGPRQVTSIFFGGGTPSLMKTSTLNTIVDRINKFFSFYQDIEITMEVNPSSTERKKLQALSKHGLNRVSIGVQSLDSSELAFLGRQHSTNDALHTIHSAMEFIPNVNIDLMYGLPNQSLEGWKSQLDTVLKMNPQHLSCYQLTIEENTVFYKQVNSGAWVPISTDLQSDFFDLTRETLVSHKMDNYEISNFCFDSFSCKHNKHIWEYQDYIGIGPGAHGRFLEYNGVHTLAQTVKIPHKYIKKCLETGSAFSIKEKTSSPQRLQEALLMGLRLADGICIEHLSQLSDKQDIYSDFIKENPSLQRFLTLQFMQIDDGYLSLTKKGWPFLDSILKDVLMDTM